CGSCGHAMVLKQAANSRFVCYFTRAASGAECYRLSIAAKELEDSLFGIISAQARTILNIGSLSDLPDIDLKLEEQSEYEKRIERLEDEKRELYEQLVTGEISVGGYRDAKTALDAELARLARTQAAIANEAAKFAEAKATGDERRRIAEIASSADTLTHPLVETLIDHVFVYPGERVEVKWKFADYFK
ncbi:MAG: hypothetical protein LBK56_14995, partial [Gracilibacteraceae bacterium]|nr:hypothetical protein [Gracilibacteraceae bacterium]